MVRQPFRPDPDSFEERVVRGEDFVHVPDVRTLGPLPDNPISRAAVEMVGLRTVLLLPLRKETALVGYIAAARSVVQPFTDREIALLQNFAAQAVIAMENARLITETRDALEQRTATAEVLQVINSSPGDLAPVFNAMLEKAMRLCEADFGSVYARNGERLERVASRGMPPEYLSAVPSFAGAGLIMPGNLLERLLGGENLISIPDLAEPEVIRLTPRFEPLVRLAGARSFIAAALRKNEPLLGFIAIYRVEVRPFGDKQIALLQNFAAQAVVAMENARLLTETREALEQQTATAEVLQVINSSPGDLAPVFDTMLEKAMRLCTAAFGYLMTYDGNRFQEVAHRGLPDAFAEYLPRMHQPGSSGAYARMLGGAPVVQIGDLSNGEVYRTSPLRQVLVDLGGARTGLVVALRRDEALLGVITIYRQEVRLFSDKEIALLQNFAQQAVIAIENARLITKTREALEQQTATSEVLGVINSSPGDLTSVFDAILEKAHTLCGATHGALGTYDDDYYFRSVVVRGYPEALAERLQQGFDGLTNPVTRPLIDGARFVHIPDLAEIDHPIPRAVASLGGFHTGLFVPLRKDGQLRGHISATRSEVRPFADKDIALLENFAAQAVIAMENARLITETRERTRDLQQSLEYQTATSDVLKVISRSDADLGTVLENLVETVTRLCQADHGYLFRRQDDHLHLIASFGIADEFRDYVEAHPFVPDRGTLVGRVALERRIVDIEDAASDPEYVRSDFQQRGNLRTGLGVPLLREDTLVGIILLWRSRVERFTEKQIALAGTFADQAVVAIENARLLGELRDRQAELRVTFDNMADGVAMFDQTLHLAAWNRNFQEILDLSDEYLDRRPEFDEYIRYLTERGEFGESNPATEIARLRSRLADHYSYERTRPDDTVIEVRHNPMPDGGVVLIFSDITERKRSEAEIRAARDAAEGAYRDLQAAQSSLVQAQKMAALGQLTAGIAHEIKNPLNFVNNFASLSTELLDELKEEVAPALATLDGNKREGIDETIEMLTGNLDKIAEHGKRADGIVKSMLEHSRGVSGERRVIDLNALIEEALNLAYHGARAQDASFNITLERDFDRGLAPIELSPQEVTRVFLNLFGNGFYATTKRQRAGAGPEFRPTLEVATRDLGNAVEVRVRDNGTGIAPEIRDKLFQPFVTTKPTGEGTGLGLSIAYDIVTQQHGGTIEVDSRGGEFTEFTIRLPRTRLTTAEAAS
jgi:GAF domain-containing protein